MRLVPVRGRIADHRWAGRPARVLARVTAVMAGLVLVAGCRVPFMSSNSAAPAAVSGSVLTVGAAPGVAGTVGGQPARAAPGPADGTALDVDPGGDIQS